MCRADLHKHTTKSWLEYRTGHPPEVGGGFLRAGKYPVDQVVQSLSHFHGSGTRKGDRDHGIDLDVLDHQNAQQALHEHLRLTGTGIGQNGAVNVCVEGGLLLGIHAAVQPFSGAFRRWTHRAGAPGLRPAVQLGHTCDIITRDRLKRLDRFSGIFRA